MLNLTMLALAGADEKQPMKRVYTLYMSDTKDPTSGLSTRVDLPIINSDYGISIP